MPKGVYLNARSLGPELLARRMNDIIKDKNKYYDFFKWHGYYSFHHTGEDNFYREICGLCELLNDKAKRRQRCVFINITQWWNESPTTTTASTPMVFIVDQDDDARGILSKFYNFVFE